MIDEEGEEHCPGKGVERASRSGERKRHGGHEHQHGVPEKFRSRCSRCGNHSGPDEGAERENEGNVRNIAPKDIPEGDPGVSCSRGVRADDGSGKRCAERDDRGSDQGRRDTVSECEAASAPLRRDRRP